MAGRVEQIVIRPVREELPVALPSVEAVAGRGLAGDCYFAPEPTQHNGKDVTLIEAEALEALEAETGIRLGHVASRRNVLTRGVRLNDLVGKRFRLGGAECVGVVLNEPCTHLESLTEPGVLRGLVHRGGLRASVVASGTIAVGDELVEVGEAAPATA